VIKIAHRGNRYGRKVEKENSPSHIEEAMRDGFHVEVDVWHEGGDYYLGHDEATYIISEKFLENYKLICHAKNIEALHKMLANEKIHCFWHEEDYCSLTSKRWIWKFPEVYNEGKLIGICSDRFEA